MSAPGTDPERQLRHHRFPIYAMIAIMVIVLLGFFWWMADETHDPQMPGAEEFQKSVRTPDSTPAEVAPPSAVVPPADVPSGQP